MSSYRENRQFQRLIATYYRSILSFVVVVLMMGSRCYLVICLDNRVRARTARKPWLIACINQLFLNELENTFDRSVLLSDMVIFSQDRNRILLFCCFRSVLRHTIHYSYISSILSTKIAQTVAALELIAQQYTTKEKTHTISTDNNLE